MRGGRARSSGRAAAFVTVWLLATSAFALAGGAAAVADDGSDPGGIGISVDIPGGGQPSSDLPPVDVGGATPDGAAPSTPPAEVSTGTPKPLSASEVSNGPVNVSGLQARYEPSIDPLGGKLVVFFTVHNGSKTAFASTVKISAAGPVGNAITSTPAVAVPTIQPGATVAIERTLTGIGQWAFVTVHATYTPPATLDGTAVNPVERDVTVFAFPWLGMSVLVLLAAGAGVVALVVHSAAAAPALVAVTT
ncbi:hypothetical protein [Leifsonia poae]|uniref:hypothetical protein n=1 Tax=Leifsonia poae TaxID=110933 RepID=UPI001CBD3087|nr:hypothetical protein [Leifsonia poae]